MQLFINDFISHSDASSSFLIIYCICLEKAEMVLSSAKLCKAAMLNQRSRSLVMLKTIGPNKEPCGTPESSYLKRLYALLILTCCLRRFK